MRKIFLMLLSVFMLLSVTLKAQTIVLSESFEDGIPTTWTQENVVGEQMWSVETDGTYPDGAYAGVKRAYLRNDSRQSLGYKTRLITPVMDLVGVYQPILKFAYAQPKWTGDVDTLRVYWRNGEKDSWRLFLEYSSHVGEWTVESVDLPGVGDAYQLAFEGSDNLGHGIVLDSILVRSKPECTVPHDLFVTNMADSAATLGWQASLDANYFQILVVKSDKNEKNAIDPDTLDLVDAADIFLNYNMMADSATYRYRGFDPGAYYHVYVRSLCDAENSEWGHTFFRMNAAERIPYVEDFNMDYNGGYVTRYTSWTYDNNTGKYNPFISTHLAPKTSDLAVYSPDSSMCMMFTGANNATTLIPAGNFVYAATPELLGEDLKDCQVRFVGTVNTYCGNYASAIIVGVMTDPEDMNTFVPIDTCRVWGYVSFEEFCVDLSSYSGNGRYVCFMSNFEKSNMFFIDDLVIEKRPKVQKVINVNVCPKDTTATFSWEGNAAHYRVLVTTEKVYNLNNVDPDAVVADVTVDTKTCTVNGLEPFRTWANPYYVYVQAMNSESEKAEWSLAKKFQTTAAAKTLPIAFSMENASGVTYIIDNAKEPKPVDINIWGNDAHAYLNTAAAYEGSSSLYINKAINRDYWYTFPRIEEGMLERTQITFYLSGLTNYASTWIGVGLMTNPMDLSTYTEVQSYTLDANGFFKCYTNFTDPSLQGKGEYIAMVIKDKASASYSYIDNVVIEEIGDCAPTTGLEAKTTENSAFISWTKSASEWDVVCSTAYLEDVTLASPDLDSNPNVLFHKTISPNPKDTILGLKPATQYHYYIRTKCSDSYSDWNSIQFKTQCTPTIVVPYTETFSNYGTGTSAFPACWNAEFPWSYNSSGTHYPYVQPTYDHTGDGVGSAYMYCTASTASSVYGSCLVSPEIEGDLSEMKLSFFYYYTTNNYEIYVGTIANEFDFSTFVPLDTFKTVASVWMEASVDLSRYKGTNKRIAITTHRDKGTTVCYAYIDDISITNSVCARPFAIQAENVHEKDLTITWGGKTSDKFELYVSATPLTLQNNAFVDLDRSKLMVDTMVSENSFFLEGLSTFTTYYVYVRPNCGEQLWAEGTVTSDCFTINPRKFYHETFDDVPKAGTGVYPSCWTVGNAQSQSTTYIPYIYSAVNSASSGNNVLRFYGYATATTTYQPAYAISPRVVTNDMSSVSISFNACYTSTSSSRLVFGVIEDPEDLSTFVVLDSMALPVTMKTYTYDLKDYASVIGNARYFMWRSMIGGTASTYAYVDDVMIYSSDCPAPNPVVSNLEAHSATFSSGLRISAPWHLIITNQNVQYDSLASSTYTRPTNLKIYKDTVVSANTRSIKLENLIEDTKYYYGVATQCEDGESLWASGSFSTVCEPVALEHFGTVSFEKDEGFISGSSDNDMGCWIVGNKGSSTATYIPYVIDNTSSATYAHSGTASLKLYSTATADGAYAISPKLDIDDISRIQLTLYGYCHTYVSDTYAHSVYVGVVTDPMDMATFVPVDTLSIEEDKAFKGFTVSFKDYESDFLGNKGKYICFLSEFAMNNYFYIDDVTVELRPSCPAPQAVEIDSVGENAVKLHWKGEADTYRVVLAKDPIADKDKAHYWDYAVDTVVNGTSAVIENIFGGTQYFPYVQAICSATDSSAFTVEIVPFNTTCPAAYSVPYFCDFNHNTATGESILPDCWNGEFINSKSSVYPYVMSYGGKNNSACLHLYSSSNAKSRSLAVAPELQIEGLASYMLSFNAARANANDNNSGKLIIGIVRNIKEIEESFYPLDTIDVALANYGKYWFDFAPYKDSLATTTRVAFMVDAKVEDKNFCDIYIDNFRIDTKPSCFPPEMTFVASTLNEAAFKIIAPDNYPASQWEVAVMKYDDYVALKHDEKIEDKARLVNVNNPECFVSGLEMGTKYAAFARTVCSEQDKSAWSDDPTAFYTKFSYKDSYSFGFERSELWERAYQATSDDYFLHPALQAGYFNKSTVKFTNSSSGGGIIGGIIGKITDLLKGASGEVVMDPEFYPHSIDNLTGTIYSRSGNGSLRLMSSNIYQGGYLLFPAITDSVDRCFSFDARAAYATVDGKISSVFDKSALTVGMIDSDKGYSSFQELAVINMPVLAGDAVAKEDNNFLFEHYQINLTAQQLAGRQLVILNHTCAEATTFIDNVKLDAVEPWSSPVIKKLIVGDTYMNVTMVGSEHTAAYLILGTDAPFDASKATLSVNDFVDSTSISGLEPETEYTLWLVNTSAQAGSTATSMIYRNIITPCAAIQLDDKSEFSYDFESNIYQMFPNATNSDTCYYYPSCWLINTTAPTITRSYVPLIQKSGRSYTAAPSPGSTYNSYVTGRNASNSLRFYVASGSTLQQNLTPYVVMPLIEAGLDTMQLEFWGRPFAHKKTGTSGGTIVATTYMNGAYSPSITVGTMTDPYDLSTFVPIDTVTYPYAYKLSTVTNVNTDPAKEEFWCKFTVPTKGAQGNYIAFALQQAGMFFMDDLVLTPRKGILPPKGASTSDVGARAAQAHWTREWQPEMKTIVILYEDGKVYPIATDTIEPGVMKYDFKDLKPNTTYTWSLKQTDGVNASEEMPAVEFTTECLSIDPSYTTGFEQADGHTVAGISGTTYYYQGECWTFGNAGSTEGWSTSFPYCLPATATANYAHSGDYGVKLYATGTTYAGYIATPSMVSVDAMDTLQISFWACPGYRNPKTGKMATTTYIGATYARSVEVGTCTDPKDPSTFVPLAIKTYQQTFTTSSSPTPANDYYFERYEVPLKGAVGPYVYIKASQTMDDGVTRNSDYMYVDDIEFIRYSECEVPAKLKQIDQTINTIDVTWQGEAPLYIVEFATDPDFKNVLALDTVDVNTFHLDGLDPNMSILWHVRAICNPEDKAAISSWSNNATAYTSLEPYVMEDFRSVTQREWTFASTPAYKAFEDGASLEGDNNISYGWKSLTSSYGIHGAHYYAPFYSSSAVGNVDFNYFWFLAPVIYLAPEKPAHLTFAYGLTKMTSGYSAVANEVTEDMMDNDQVFMVVISDDGGKTWKRENATVWSNGNNYGTPDYELRSIPTIDGQMEIDLSKYAGKYIQIGFYREALNYRSPSAGIHIGKIRVNYYDLQTVDEQHCQYEDASAFNNRFFINGDEAQPGLITMKDYYMTKETEMAVTPDKKDTIYVFNADYIAAPSMVVMDTICEGRSYTPSGFKPYNKSGIYRMKLTSAVTGCDSIVTLHLDVTPAVRYNEEATLCPGETYQWNGKILNRSGLYRDTTTSLVTGCDSISSLVLTYLNAGDTITKEVTITEDDLPYTYESITYPIGTKPGVYTDTIYVQSGECKGVLIHKLTINVGADLEQIIDMNALQSGVHKLLIREQLYIVRDGEWYDALGKSVNCPL